MRILIVTQDWPTTAYRRAGIFAFDEYQSYLADGHDVCVLVLFRWALRARGSFWESGVTTRQVSHCNELLNLQARNDDFKVVLMAPFPVSLEISLFFARLPPIFTDIDFDLILINSILGAGSAIAWLRRIFVSSNFVLREHDDPSLMSDQVFQDLMSKYCHFDWIWANSKFTKKALLAKMGGVKKSEKFPAIVIKYPRINPLFLNLGHIYPPRFGFKFLTVCNLIREKCIEKLIKLMKVLDEFGLDWDWAVVGDGRLRKGFQQLVAARGWTRRVTFEGEMFRHELLALYQKSTIYVQFSVGETFGVAPLEAYLSGCKLIVSENVPSLHELGLVMDSDVFVVPSCEIFATRKGELLDFLNSPKNYDADFRRFRLSSDLKRSVLGEMAL